MWEAFHRIQSALKDLHKGPITEVMRVARLEWYFNALFANRTIEAIDASCCNKRMAFDPVFFVKVVKGLSEGKRAPKKIDYSRGAKVLNTWRAVPGVDAGGATGDKEFQVWMDKVLEQTRNNDVCKNRCLKWIGSCLAKLTIPNASLFSMEGMWSFVDSGEGLVVRNEFEKVLKNTGLMPCIFNHKGRETMKDLYFKFYSMAKEYGYNNVALSYKGALEHIEGLQPLA